MTRDLRRRFALLVAVAAVPLVVTDIVGGGEGVAPPAATPAPAAMTSIEGLQAHLRAQPADAAGWARLGMAYVEHARVTGDSSAYPRAEDAFRESLQAAEDGNDAALAGLAALAVARHDFAEGLQAAERALAVNPRNAVALAMRTDALTELGRYDDALAAAEEADRLRPSAVTFTRLAYQAELRGQDGLATKLLERAAGPGGVAADPFVAVQLSQLRRHAGDLEGAAEALAALRRAGSLEVDAVAAQARLAVARGQLQRAASLWAEAVRRTPRPDLLVEQAELLLVLGRHREARQALDLARVAARLAATSGSVVDLEIALLHADHGDPHEALSAARAAWRQRRTTHTADALAWALHQTGQHRAALPLAQQATALGRTDPGPWWHRAEIEAALGREGEARRHARLALSMDPGWSPWQAARARDLAVRGVEG